MDRIGLGLAGMGFRLCAVLIVGFVFLHAIVFSSGVRQVGKRLTVTQRPDVSYVVEGEGTGG